MLNVTPISAFTDNYIWVIIHSPSKHCLIVDPGQSEQVIEFINHENLHPIAILLTHHHADHVGGAANLREYYNIPVYGPALENIPSVTHPLTGNETLSITELNAHVQVISIPGHTKGHVAYYTEGLLFCGDTLFTGGCGRIFEGNAEQMLQSLNCLATLPDTTLIYCGHEYTQANLAFAQTIDPNNPALELRITETNDLTERGIPTVPSTLYIEKQTNPFLRCDCPAIIAAATTHSGRILSNTAEVFTTIRLQKNSFKFNQL